MTYRALRKGFRVVEVPIRFIDRRVGQSKMSGSIFFEALTLVWQLRARIGRDAG
jgi:dolichol-phosphate mannosyltransferase